MKYLKILFLFLLVSNYTFSQSYIDGNIKGFGDIKTFKAFLPIGKFYNGLVPINVPVNNDSTFHLKVDLSRGALIKFRIGYQPVDLYVEPGDKIRFSIENGERSKLNISGHNSAGSLWYNRYFFLPAANYDKQDYLVKQINTKSAESIFKSLKDFLNKETYGLDSLLRLRKINKNFANLAKKDVYALHLQHFDETLNNKNFNKQKISDLKHLIFINYPIDSAYAKNRFGEAYLTSILKYNTTYTPDSKSKYSNEVFGPYNNYFYLPPFFQEYLFGEALILQKVYSATEFNFDTGYKAFKERFPKSAYVPIVDILLENERPVNGNPLIKLDTTYSVNSLAAVAGAHSGHNILIDLWATWCLPCRMEFPNYKLIKDDLKQFDVTPVFISIDEPALKKAWEKMAFEANLEGYHVIANNALKSDIESVVYKNDSLSIPRYILINKKGEIISVDAPRPSDRANLIKLFKERL